MARTALLIGGAGGTGVYIAQGLRDKGFDVTILHRGVHEPAEIADFPHIHADPHFAEPMAEAVGSRTFDLVVATYGRIQAIAPFFAGRCGQFLAVGGIPVYAGFLDAGSVVPRGVPIGVREDAPLAPARPEGGNPAAAFAGKIRAAEDVVMEQHGRGGYAASIFRYPAVYGPRALLLTEWSIIKRIQDGRRFILLPNEGLTIFTRCAAANGARTLLLAVDNPAAAGRVFNCADEDQFSMAQWTELTLRALGGDARIIGLPKAMSWAAGQFYAAGPTATDHGVVEARAAREVLGYTDAIPARDALVEAVAWRVSNPPAADEAPTWPDKFDYAMEDEVLARLDRFNADCAEIATQGLVAHPYAHPKESSLGTDHRGR
ncbi:MAG: hypothetical protein JO303_15240 [Caulobacteraceae bacterium]|nr:hypothetical protein [Caulobacteraceae bacterium]